MKDLISCTAFVALVILSSNRFVRNSSLESVKRAYIASKSMLQLDRSLRELVPCMFPARVHLAVIILTYERLHKSFSLAAIDN